MAFRQTRPRVRLDQFVTPRVLMMAMVAVSAIVYLGVYQCGFVNFDDPAFVWQNAHVMGGFSLANLAWTFTTFEGCIWHPLTWLSLMLDAHLWGPAPWAFHLTGLAWHLANIVMLYGAMRALTGKPWSSAAVAAIFALHPVHVESVAWISERKDVLSAFFFFAALWAYARRANRPGWPGMALVSLFMALGLMAKATVVTLPAVLLLLDFWPLGRLSRASLVRLVLEKWPLWLMAAGGSVLAVLAQKECGALVDTAHLPLLMRVPNVLVAYAIYLGKVFLPTDYSLLYLFRPNPSIWEPISAGLLLAGLSAAAFGLRRAVPAFSVGWLWFVVMFLPMVGIVQVGSQALADRYAYLPFIGLYLALVFTWGEFIKRRPQARQAVLAVFLAWLAVLGWLTWVRVDYWQDTDTIYRQSLALEPDNYLVMNYLAEYLLGHGRFVEAKELLLKALGRNPDYATVYVNLGRIYIVQKRLGEAMRAFAVAREVNKARSTRTPPFDSWGVSMLMSGRPEVALIYFEQALEWEPSDPLAAKGRAKSLELLGR